MKKAEVNIKKINKLSEKNELIAVPGKVLGKGRLKKPVKVAAEEFSSKAEKKIEKAGGKIIKLKEIKEKPEKVIT